MLNDVLDWLDKHAWYARYAPQIRKKHLAYLSIVIENLNEISERAMNESVLKVPFEKRTSTLVPEILTAYINAKKRA